MHLIAFLAAILAQQPAPLDPDEGTLSSVKPKIPEPMVFDLVRPLGAKRGEFEINSLFRVPTKPNAPTLLWAPEIEYTFANGMGVELEFPLEDRQLDAYKLALQTTLPGSFRGRTIHGLQGIGEFTTDRKSHQVDLLYLHGVRFSQRWSAFSMLGARRESAQTVRYAPLFNQSIFRKQNRYVHFGLESNYKGRANSPRSLLLMPQTHLKYSRLNFQFGAGLLREQQRHRPVLSWRLSREF
jgi:hypothetical protein